MATTWKALLMASGMARACPVFASMNTQSVSACTKVCRSQGQRLNGAVADVKEGRCGKGQPNTGIAFN